MKVPYTNFKTREGDTDEVGGCTFIGGSWKDVDTAEIFDNKKVVVFGLAGFIVGILIVTQGVVSTVVVLGTMMLFIVNREKISEWISRD